MATSTEPALSSTWYSEYSKCRAGSREVQRDKLRKDAMACQVYFLSLLAHVGLDICPTCHTCQITQITGLLRQGEKYPRKQKTNKLEESKQEKGAKKATRNSYRHSDVHVHTHTHTHTVIPQNPKTENHNIYTEELIFLSTQIQHNKELPKTPLSFMLAIYCLAWVLPLRVASPVRGSLREH